MVFPARVSAGLRPGKNLSMPNHRNTTPSAMRMSSRPCRAMAEVMRRSMRSRVGDPVNVLMRQFSAVPVARDPEPHNIAPMAAKTSRLLPFTGNDEADRLLEEDPLALLIGFELDQQVTLQKAFSGPFELKKRIGTLDAARIAAMDPEELAAAFRERPALHRF